MEFILAIGLIYFLWKIVSEKSNSKSKELKNRRHGVGRNKRHSSPYLRGNSSYGGYSGRPAYIPIKITTSGIPIKSDLGYRASFRPSNRKKSDFNYIDNPNPQEFLVYFVASEDLGALKIGVGTSGRVLQLLNSTIRSEDGFENVGWKVIKTAAFSSGPDDYELGRECAYEAERRVLFYWRKHLGLAEKVSEIEMGWAEVEYLGSRGFRRTKGYSETVDIDSVCEVSTWNIVVGSPGYLGDGSSFYEHRALRSNSDASISSSIPPRYREYKKNVAEEQDLRGTKGSIDLDSNDREPADKTNHSNLSTIPVSKSIRKNKPMPKSDGTKEGKFWARVDKTAGGCWNWVGSISTHSGYGQMLWEGSPRPAHRISWQLKYGEMPVGDLLMNLCGKRTCVNPDHWKLNKLQERKCVTPNCDGISVKKMVDGYCKKCERRREYEHRKNRPNPYACTNPSCRNPSGTVAYPSLCMSCRRKQKN